jgi:uncharacterized coiled-coil DUF342 family protein
LSFEQKKEQIAKLSEEIKQKHEEIEETQKDIQTLNREVLETQSKLSSNRGQKMSKADQIKLFEGMIQT